MYCENLLSFSDNPLKTVKCIKDETDLTQVMPVKRMQG